MKIFRKIIVAVLSMSLLFSSVCIAESASEYSADTISVSFAKGMGIVSDFAVDKTVTIGELAEAVVKISDNTQPIELYFNEHFYEKEAKYAEAVAVFVDVAGYGKYTQFKYGDNSIENILLTARDIGLTGNTMKSSDAVLTQSDLVNLVYNILYVKVPDYIYSDDGTCTLKISTDLYMNRILGMYTVDGIIEETSFSSILSEEGSEVDSIVIEGESYKCEKGKYEDYIGHYVTAFIKNNDGISEVVTIHNRSKVTVVEAKDIIKTSTDKYNIDYYNQNGRKVSLKLDKMASVLYNYSLDMDYTEDDFKINQGRLILVDNNSDGRYEVVRIEEYESIMIYSVSVSTLRFIDAYGNSRSLEAMEKNGYPIYDEGNLTSIENIPSGSIATIYSNRDGEIVRLCTTLKQTAVRVSSFEHEDNEIKAEDNTIYRYTDEIKAEIEKYKAGDLMTIWLDIYGNIAYFDVSEDVYLYGYLISFTEGSAIEAPMVKLFTEDNKVEVMSVRETVNFNGKKMAASEAFSETNYDSGLWDAVGKINQAVKYKTNSAGEITAFMTTTNYDLGETERPYKVADGNYRYFSGPSTITPTIRLSPYTKVFLVPETLDNYTRYRYGLKNVLSNNTTYTCQVFDVDENCYAGAVVCRVSDIGKQTVDAIASPVYVIKSVGRHLNDLGEESVCLEVYNNDNVTTEIKFSSIDIAATFQEHIVSVADLKQGDIIQVSADAKHTMENSNMLVRYLNGRTTPYESAAAQWYAYSTQDYFCSDGYTYCAGTVKKFIKDGVIINNKPEGTEDIEKWNRVVTTKSNTPVFVCDNTRGTVTYGTVADLEIGDTVFTLLRNGSPTKFVVYKD